MNDNMTFRQIESKLGLNPLLNELKSTLGEWYESVRDKKLSGLTDEDLCICCRQGVFLDYIVPIAIRCITCDPLAGEKYEGEMIVALKSVPESYWAENRTQSNELKQLLEAMISVGDSELQSDISDFFKKLR